MKTILEYAVSEDTDVEVRIGEDPDYHCIAYYRPPTDWQGKQVRVGMEIVEETPAVSIDRKILQIVFDTAVGSMNFGSGFLDDEEVDALRALAVLLDVDPLKATPYNFMCKHVGHCEPYSTDPNAPKWQRQCKYCCKDIP